MPAHIRQILFIAVTMAIAFALFAVAIEMARP